MCSVWLLLWDAVFLCFQDFIFSLSNVFSVLYNITIDFLELNIIPSLTYVEMDMRSF